MWNLFNPFFIVFCVCVYVHHWAEWMRKQRSIIIQEIIVEWERPPFEQILSEKLLSLGKIFLSSSCCCFFGNFPSTHILLLLLISHRYKFLCVFVVKQFSVPFLLQIPPFLCVFATFVLLSKNTRLSWSSFLLHSKHRQFSSLSNCPSSRVLIQKNNTFTATPFVCCCWCYSHSISPTTFLFRKRVHTQHPFIFLSFTFSPSTVTKRNSGPAEKHQHQKQPSFMCMFFLCSAHDGGL